MSVERRLGGALATVLIALSSVFVNAQDPTACPSGWKSARSRVDLPKTGSSGSNFQKKTIAVDIPADAEVMEIAQSSQHPKFCWKESSSSKWECGYSDPWQPAWFRFDQFKPDQSSPKGGDYKRYSVVAQNESHDRDRNAQLVICYR